MMTTEQPHHDPHSRLPGRSRLLAFAVMLAALLLTSSPAVGADTTSYEKQIRPFLVQHCGACHDGKKVKGDFRLDQLSSDFGNAASQARWRAVLEQIQVGAMPPKSKPRPPAKELQALTDWIIGNATAANLRQRAAEGRVVYRRLNRIEFENTLRDLLGAHVEVKDLLPEDSSAGGFDNVGQALHVSSFLMDKYLEAVDVALSRAISNGAQPRLVKQHAGLTVRKEMQKYFLQQGETVVCFSSHHARATGAGWVTSPGNYRYRISASGYQSSGKPVTFRVQTTQYGKRGNVERHVIGYFDAPADKPTVVEFVDHRDTAGMVSVLPYGLPDADFNKVSTADYKGPGLAVQWVEVEGPLHDSWPPASQRRLFGDLPQAPMPTKKDPRRVEVVSKDPDADARRVLSGFIRRAFRRPVRDEDIEPYAALVKARLAEKYTFEQAVRVGLTAVMVSPNFLFLCEKPGKLDDFALASRLSYFLWSTMPDDELLALAEQKKLGQPDLLRQQVERMLKDPRAAAFTQNFLGQWLNLREIDFTTPSNRLYPEFDEMLRLSMLREPELFFNELLTHNLSLTNFVASDFSMLNGRLATHYGIPGVDGWTFRKVKLPADSHRGGVMTMASVLKVTANGTNTSPVTRGAWVLDRLLATPPPRPPANVPALEPDIRGATTIRQQLAKHRQIDTCAACHAKIDPPGFALESFDAIGAWRENYRTTTSGKPVIVGGRKMPYLNGPKVELGDVLPDGRRFRDIDEFKQLLLRDKDQLARALTTKLLTYATGATPEAADQPALEAIVRKTRDQNYGLRTLVHEIVQSQLFLNK
jgi:hypothetical protein